MKFKKIFLASLIISFVTPSYALFCPSNFNQINIGDTIDQVTAQCGAPATKKTSESSEDQPQEWVYFLNQGNTNPSVQQTASLRTTIAFNKGKVTNISVNGIGISYTQICAGNTVQVGTTQDAVKQACGAPQYINQSNTPEAKAQVNKITTYTYNSTPPITLIFENGLLKERK